MIFLDPEKTAAYIRAALATNMKTQKELAAQLGIERWTLNNFLRRKYDLKQEDILRALKILNLEHLIPKLSITASIDADLDLKTGRKKL